MDPSLWGYNGWAFIHNIALGYNDINNYQTKNNFNIFFNSIGDVIPCKKCSKHYKEYILNNPPNLENKDSLFKWTIDIHNNVNKILNKDIITYEEAYDIWLNNKKNKNNNNNKIINYFLIILIIIIIIIKIIF